MDLITLIDDGVAIVRAKRGVLKQCKIYHYKGKVYLGISGVYVRITDKFDTYGTVDPDIKVLDLQGANVLCDGNKAPEYRRQGWK